MYHLSCMDVYGAAPLASFPSASRISIARVPSPSQCVKSRRCSARSPTSAKKHRLFTTSTPHPVWIYGSRFPVPEGVEKEMGLAECAASCVTLLIAETRMANAAERAGRRGIVLGEQHSVQFCQSASSPRSRPGVHLHQDGAQQQCNIGDSMAR